MEILNKIKQFIPGTHWIFSYSKRKFSGDLSAGLTTGLMFIPQAMAYAIIAGMPPIYGLYAGVIPLLIFPFLSSSKHISIGPVAIDMLIISAGMIAIATPNTPEYVGLVIILTLMTGLFQLFMGFLGLGSILNFFSRPIIAGFTFAAPIIIASSQLSNLLGLELSRSEDILILLREVVENIQDTHLLSLGWGLTVIVLLYILKKIYPIFPSSAVILFLSIFIAYYFNVEELGVKLVGDIPKGLPTFSIPGINDFRKLLTTAIILTLIQFMNVAALGRTFAKRHKYIFDTNREITAVGAANFLGSFFKAIPVSASFSRSAVAEQSNARTPFHNFITGVVVVAALLFLTPVFYYMPMTVLAAIIIAFIIKMITLREFKTLFRTSKTEGIIAVSTAAATLFIGIQEGIFLGVLASLLKTLYHYTRPHVAELGLVPGTRLFMDIERNPDAHNIRNVLIIRVEASFSYINADYFRDVILSKSKKKNKNTEYVIIDGSTINTMDSTAIEQLEIMVSTLRGWGMDLYITGLRGHIRDILTKSGFVDTLGEDHFFREPHEAVQYLLKIMDERRLANYKKVIKGEEIEEEE